MKPETAIKKHLLHILLSNKCTCCGEEQKEGIIFYDYGKQYLCPSCNERQRD